LTAEIASKRRLKSAFFVRVETEISNSTSANETGQASGLEGALVLPCNNYPPLAMVPSAWNRGSKRRLAIRCRLRQDHRHSCAPSGVAYNLHIAAVQDDDLFNDRQTQSGSP
jgi:hypothetical protein